MDRKTLEYMEERAGKAREIVNKIEKLQTFLNQVQSKSFMCVRLAIDSGSIDITRWGSSKVPNNYLSEAEASMINAFVAVTKAEIQTLEKELAEL